MKKHRISRHDIREQKDVSISSSNAKSNSLGMSKLAKSQPNEAEITAGYFHKYEVPAFLIFVSSFILNCIKLHPSLLGGDSGELIFAAYELGVAHPPGYPLFTMLAKLFMTVIPFGSIAWRVNLLSAFCSALNSAILFITVYRLTFQYGAAIFASFVFSYSPLVCVWSVTAEVFSLNNLLLSYIMLTAVLFDAGSKESLAKISLIGSFLSGLCLTNQHTSILYIIPLIPWVFYKLWNKQLFTVSLLVKQGVSFLCGLSPYLYLPLSSWLHVARWTWGDSSSLRGFLKHLLREEYGTWDLLKDHTGQGFATGLIAYINHLLIDVSRGVFALAVFSIFSIYSRYRSRHSSVLLVFGLMLLTYISFFCWRANLDINKPLFYKVVERFWIQSDLILVILASQAFADICSYLKSRLNLQNLSLDIIIVIPLLSTYILSGWSACDQSGNFLIQDFALQMLHKFPKGSIILTKGDLPSNSFRYYHFIENVRPDLSLFDQEVLTYEWSLPMTSKFTPGIKFPGDLMHLYSGVRSDGKRTFTFKDLLDANYARAPIFACIGAQEHDSAWKASYELWPFGVCWQFVDKGRKLDTNLWTNATAGVADDWMYPWTSFDDGSWENVANSEMWRAKTVTAYFYLEEALALPEGSQDYVKLLLESYKLYTIEIKKHTIYPAYWHRNYAIVCERLMREKTPLDELMLLGKTIEHFKQFVLMEPGDADAEKLHKAIRSLEDYKNSLTTS
ncbi:unnamed protein product [Lymnaea stagnalis]|uniref:Transmembrane protein 260 n=1 Tax=Lymnaea stagnalis TaxID=6523 RepID=A0AAV2I3G2_LYMST